MHQATMQRVIIFDNVEHKLVLTKLMALAWLPADDIRPTFNLLKDAVEQSQYGRIFIGLMVWFEHNFIHGLQPVMWSYFDKDQLFSSWPEHVPQLLINEVFSGAQIPTRRIPFFKFYGKSFCQKFINYSICFICVKCTESIFL